MGGGWGGGCFWLCLNSTFTDAVKNFIQVLYVDQSLHIKCLVVEKRYSVLVDWHLRAAGFSVGCSVSMTTPHNPSHAPNFLQHISLVSLCVLYTYVQDRYRNHSDKAQEHE